MRFDLSRQSQRGLGLPVAIFIITVMAFLAVAVNRIVQSNAFATGEAIGLTRAFYAAQSGLEFGLNDVFPPDGIASDLSASRCAALNYPAFDVPGLNNCTAAITCSALDVDADGDGADESYYTIRSTGTCGGVSRVLQVRAQ